MTELPPLPALAQVGYTVHADDCPTCGHRWHGLVCNSRTWDMDRPVCGCEGPAEQARKATP